MKVQLGDMFLTYSSNVLERKQELLKDKENYENSKSYLLNRLEEHRLYIQSATNIKYEVIAKLDKQVNGRFLRKPNLISDENIENIRRSINMIIEINKLLKKINVELQELNENAIDEKTFRGVINFFNETLSNEILYEAYTFRIGYQLGVIRIKRILCDKRIKKKINWSESLKVRNQLLKEGKTPYKVLERDADNNVIKHNGGEHWFVYFTGNFDFLWHWSKNRNILLNSAYYKFRPTVYNNVTKGGDIGNANKLAQLKALNAEILKYYL